MFLIDTEKDRDELIEFSKLLEEKERIILTELSKVSPLDNAYKDILNCFNTTFSVRTAADSAITAYNLGTKSENN